MLRCILFIEIYLSSRARVCPTCVSRDPGGQGGLIRGSGAGERPRVPGGSIVTREVQCSKRGCSTMRTFAHSHTPYTQCYSIHIESKFKLRVHMLSYFKKILDTHFRRVAVVSGSQPSIPLEVLVHYTLLRNTSHTRNQIDIKISL